MANGRGSPQTRAKQAKRSDPYAAIQHRVMDSPAFTSLSFSARSVLLVIVRQLSKDNNGHLLGSSKYMARYGIVSEHTVSRALQELVAHGLVRKTRSGGFHKGASLYAVTWLPLSKNTNGIHPAGFLLDAWKNWEPPEKIGDVKNAPS